MHTEAEEVRALHEQRVASQHEELARYWQQCDQLRDHKLSRMSSGTLVSEEEEDDDCEYDDEDDEVEYEYRYVHYRRRSSRNAEVSGLPLVCANCGVSFYSLRAMDVDDDCFCSGECKWSVIICREIDRRMSAFRARPSQRKSCGEEDESGYQTESSQYTDEVISCR